MAGAGHASPEAAVTVFIVFTATAVIAVLLRLYSRMRLVNNAGIDDAFITISAILSVGQAVTQCYQVKLGTGRHIWNVAHQDLTESLKPLWASIVVYNLAIFFTKCSILVQYLRIFPHRTLRIRCWILLGLTFVYSCWTVGSSIWFCTPIQGFWNKQIKSHCLAEANVWYANAAVNIVLDFATALLPLPFLKELQLPKRQKVALMVVFGLGGFTCVVSILRLSSLPAFLGSTDITWNSPLVAVWSSVEINTGILCSCLPTLKALVTRVFPRIFHSSYLAASLPGHHKYGSIRGTNNTRINHESFGRGLSGKDHCSKQTTVVRGPSSAKRDSIEEIEFADRSKGIEAEEGIQVFTVLEQQVERDGYARSETESTRSLVRIPPAVAGRHSYQWPSTKFSR